MLIPMDLLPLNIAVYGYKEGSFVIVDFNREAEKTENVKREEIIGQKLTDVFPGVKEFGLLEVLERVYETGQSEHFKAGYYRDEKREGWRANTVSRLDDGSVMAVYEDVTNEIKLIHSLESLGNLVNTSLNEIYIIDAETLVFCYANHSALKNIGYTMDELSRMRPVDIKPEFDEETFRKQIRPLLEESLPQLTVETYHRRKDGTRYDVEARLQKIVYEEREHFVVFVLDISERIKNEHEMFKLQHIIEQSDDLIMITDSQGSIECVNDAYPNFTGWEKEKFIQAKPSLLKSGNASREFYEEMWQTILSGNTYKGNIQNRKKDGTLYWEEKTITPIKLQGDEITHFISSGKEITEQIQLKKALEESEMLFKTLTESALAGIFLFHETFLYINPAACRMIGYTPDELKTISPADLVEPEDREMINQRLRARLNGDIQGQSVYENLRIVTKSGKIRWFYIAIVSVRYKGEMAGLGTAIDMTERRRMEKQLELAAQTDPLTGLYNRLRFEEIIQREIAFGRRYDVQLSIIYIDIDYFKMINDTYGHDAGDRILKEIALIIRDTIRVSDYPFRWGGEEFIVVCPGALIRDVEVLAERLREEVEQRNFQMSEPVTVSMGVTQYRLNESVDEMIKRADKALYRAKESGRNRVVEEL